MGTPYMSEIRLMSFNFAPKNWALCNGQLLPINQNQALFSLLGTTYGGNGQTTFALPNLQGRVPLHMGSAFVLGELGGEQAHTLLVSEMPQHFHSINVSTSTSGGIDNPAGNFLGGANNLYHAPVAQDVMSPGTIGNAGGSQPHNNMQPYLTLSFCIALQGVFPSQN
jgi:microcystin-dependent protein